ncbi:MAG: DNA repair protein RadC [Acidobacteriota bacterium]|nr:DNA repair protein RadC [Acidobacteriota bacterium]
MPPVASHDRPREKLARAGVEALGDNELLAVVLGTGARGYTALDVANGVLDGAGGLRGLARMGRDELSGARGIGPARAARVQAAIEIGRRTLTRDPADRPQFGTPAEVAAFLLPQFGSYPVERFGVLLLDTRHRLIRARILSVGSVDASVVHPREVFREAILAGAAAVVLFHNHPSGDPSPSRDDLALTRRLVSAGDLVGIDVIDHLVLADAKYASMKESGRL